MSDIIRAVVTLGTSPQLIGAQMPHEVAEDSANKGVSQCS